jgi:flagellar hook-associated protein 1 FlgK
MQSTFSGIELGKRSLFAHQTALETTGHNLSNSATEGYSRQNVHLEAFDPLYRPGLSRPERPGQIGQGVELSRIERVRDLLLENRIVSQANAETYWEERDKYMLMLDQIYNEPTEVSVRSQMDRFWDSWQELSVFPEQMAAREAVIERGQALTEAIQLRYDSLHQVGTMLNDEVEGGVRQVNDLIERIAILNDQIERAEGSGQIPNDLYDRRDMRVEDLAQFMNITVDRTDPDEFNIFTSGFHIVQGSVARPFRTEGNPQNEGYSDIVWDYNGEELQISGGRLAAFVELRDVDVREEIQNLDNMTVNFAELVNEIHAESAGLGGETGENFFTQFRFVENALGNFDADSDGSFDSSYIFRISGNNGLDPQQQIGLAGTLTLSGPEGNIEVNYTATDTVGDLLSRINNSSSEVVARLDREGRLSLKATPSASMDNPDFVIRHVEDSGQFLVGYAGILNESGPDGAFEWQQADAVLSLQGGELEFAVAPLPHPSGWIEVNEDLVREPARIAASAPGPNGQSDPGNGQAALAVASLRNQPVMVGQISTFDDYFADAVASVGLRSEEADLSFETQERVMKDLRDLRQSISGVNIDEELSNMIKFQHGYSAAARFISEVDEMLNTIINRMGV